MGLQGSEPSESIAAETDRLEELLIGSVKPAHVWRLFDLVRSEERLELSGRGFSVSLEGESISRHLEGCEQAAVIAVTLGTAADRFLKKAVLQDGLSGLCADALASAFTEAALDEAVLEVIHETGLFATWCFAPGYGDLPLGTADKFITAVDANRRIGLSVTGSGMLVPQKSIVGVVGLSSRELSDSRRGCLNCGMRETCEFRKSGGSCNR